MKRTLAIGALVLASMSACGGGDSTSDADGQPTTAKTASDPLAGLPQCDDVWVVGKTLAKDYDGCLKNDEALGTQYDDCADGGRLAYFEPDFFALYGGEIKRGDSTAAANDCTG